MRERYGFRRFRVEADHEPDAEPNTQRFECAVCGDAGPKVEVEMQETPEAQVKAEADAGIRAADWIADHRNANREHLTYRRVFTTPYRVVPGEWSA
ncbi:DUF7848 domain-containing protein [Streptomyces violascens]|uniref:DUF7848 domain-containing protein n=1 Tax=Streptomyces violascens TaxID=67381 RepID=A0ABQ3QQW3_9ACTN|nr:hypothetical protein [Streptomyces violascens]GGU49266.1 hypothetical protein GCM10010289_82310 [Streptomyces violascens]GHI39657.1 hypothetical protein Sviol_40650 [Streptomyces violascens]